MVDNLGSRKMSVHNTLDNINSSTPIQTTIDSGSKSTRRRIKNVVKKLRSKSQGPISRNKFSVDTSPKQNSPIHSNFSNLNINTTASHNTLYNDKVDVDSNNNYSIEVVDSSVNYNKLDNEGRVSVPSWINKPSSQLNLTTSPREKRGRKFKEQSQNSPLSTINKIDTNINSSNNIDQRTLISSPKNLINLTSSDSIQGQPFSENFDPSKFQMFVPKSSLQISKSDKKFNMLHHKNFKFSKNKSAGESLNYDPSKEKDRKCFVENSKIFGKGLNRLPLTSIESSKNGSKIRNVPEIVKSLTSQLIFYSKNTELLLRKGSTTANQNILKDKLNKASKESFNREMYYQQEISLLNDALATGDIFKKFFRYLPEPLIPMEQYKKLLQFGKLNFTKNDTEHDKLSLDNLSDTNSSATNEIELKLQIKEISKIVSSITEQVNLDTLDYIIESLNIIASFSNVNKMKPESLGIVVAPNIFPYIAPVAETLIDTFIIHKLTKFMIQNYNEIFNSLDDETDSKNLELKKDVEQPRQLTEQAISDCINRFIFTDHHDISITTKDSQNKHKNNQITTFTRDPNLIKSSSSTPNIVKLEEKIDNINFKLVEQNNNLNLGNGKGVYLDKSGKNIVENFDEKKNEKYKFVRNLNKSCKELSTKNTSQDPETEPIYINKFQLTKQNFTANDPSNIRIHNVSNNTNKTFPQVSDNHNFIKPNSKFKYIQPNVTNTTAISSLNSTNNKSNYSTNTVPLTNTSSFTNQPKPQKSFKRENLQNNRLKALEKSVEAVFQKMDENRRADDRPWNVANMSKDQLNKEKRELQQELLDFEEKYGRPEKKVEKDIVRLIYDRYREVKRSLRATTNNLDSTISANSMASTISKRNNSKTFDNLRHKSEHDQMKNRASYKSSQQDGRLKEVYNKDKQNLYNSREFGNFDGYNGKDYYKNLKNGS